MRRILSNEKGASSVLVIFMMILLVSIGTFAIISSNSNHKFSYKPLEWNAEYFAMDDKAERYVMEVDALLSDAESKTIDYFMDGTYKMPSFDGLPSEIQTGIYTAWTGENNKVQVLNDALNKVYFGFIEQRLPLLHEKYPESSNSILSAEGDYFADASINFISDTEEDSNLNIYLLLLPVKYDITLDDSNLEGNIKLSREPGFKRYEISNWNQWQQLREVEQTHDVWIPE